MTPSIGILILRRAEDEIAELDVSVNVTAFVNGLDAAENVEGDTGCVFDAESTAVPTQDAANGGLAKGENQREEE